MPFKVNTRLKNEIVGLKDSGNTFKQIGEILKIPTGTAKTHYYLTKGQPSYKIPESPYPRYDSPPIIEGDALILPDAEIPFHHAEFINRVLELAQAWKIKQMIAAGDLLHFDSLSGWEPNWKDEEEHGVLDDDDEKTLVDFAMTLSKSRQQELLDITMKLGKKTAEHDYGEEMKHSRKTLRALNECFDSFVWVLGNHEGRLLRTYDSPLPTSELLVDMELKKGGKWTIAPFYYCLLNSNGETFRITHPKTTANGAARGLASQYFQHIIMGHSHKMFFDWDTSGKYYAIQMGHCVDEERLAYVAQRDCKRDSHKLGAVIVRNGYPYLLTEQLDWERMKKL
jgi:predicted phosphodiesterase